MSDAGGGRAQARLVERLRALLAGEPTSRELTMFGGHAFMVNDRIVVSAWGNGDLLVRVAAERTDELCALPGAAPAQMRGGRRLGAGWITVGADAIAADGQLARWVETALDRDP